MAIRVTSADREAFVALMEGTEGVAAPAPKAQRRETAGRVRGRYDAAQTNVGNLKHWEGADALSANGANSPAVRDVLRKRARYEAANNGYAKGLLRTIRNDVIGTGARLQVSLPDEYADPDFGTQMRVRPGAGRAVELAFARWADAAGLDDKLRVLLETGDRDGECFAVAVSNPALPDAVKLDLRLIEGDQCATPDLVWTDRLAVDGIRFDEAGNPTEYHFLKQHPGDPFWQNPWDYDRIAAKYVLHWFDPDRPNQARGVPAITPGLPLYSQLRRYTLATLGAAELAANLAGILYTDQAADPDDAADVETMDTVPIPRQALLTAPAGWKAEQFKPEQPVSTYREFKGELLTEAGRPLCAPRNVSTASSAEYNYSSARLDHLPYQRAIRITRERVRRAVLARVFFAWLYEARLVPGYLPADLPPVALWQLRWQWDGFESIDPVKDATADDIALKNGTRTRADIYGARGKDWEEALRQQAKEAALARRLETEYGLAPGTLSPLAASGTPVQPQPEPEGADAQTQDA